MTEHGDVIVVGAGTSGTAAAILLARQGRDVLLVDRRTIDHAGGNWSVDVPEWMFHAAGIAPPRQDEVVGRIRSFSFAGVSGRAAVRVPLRGLVEVDLPALLARLHDEAGDAGVRFRSDTMVTRIEGGLVHLENDRHIRARLVVDARGHDPRVPPRDVCHAAQAVHRIEDLDGTLEWLAEAGAGTAESIAWTGRDGGYSTLTVRVEPGLDRVSIIAGGVVADGNRPGAEILDEFVDDHGWIGGRLSGGEGRICLAGPRGILAGRRVARVGEAARQVFPAHASGVGSGLLAARCLADAIASHSDPGRDEALWDYQVTWQRGFGAVCAAYDVFRRSVQDAGPEAVDRLVTTRLLSPGLLEASLMQRLGLPRPAEIGESIRTMPAGWRTARWLLPGIARMGIVHVLHRGHPADRDPHRFGTWSGYVRRVSE